MSATICAKDRKSTSACASVESSSIVMLSSLQYFRTSSNCRDVLGSVNEIRAVREWAHLNEISQNDVAVRFEHCEGNKEYKPL